MNVLVGCEFSGIVRDAFIARGHEAWSCDLLPTEKPGPHIQGNLLDYLSEGWDLAIFHPPCTYLSVVSNRAFATNPLRRIDREIAAQFFRDLWHAPIPRIAIENPVGYMNTHFMRPDQIIHPYHFGEPVQKRTCLWLVGLPLLIVNKEAKPPLPNYYCKGVKSWGKAIGWTEGYVGKDRSHQRSRTFQSIADAMASQWG